MFNEDQEQYTTDEGGELNGGTGDSVMEYEEEEEF